MNELQELLSQWAELEPDRCKKYPAFFKVLLDGEYEIINSVHRGKKQQAVIEYAVREAILNRGWDIVAAISQESCDVSIITTPKFSEESFGLLAGAPNEETTHKIPTIALLIAYIFELKEL